MQLLATPFRLALQLHGEPVRWFKAMPCSHRNAATNYDDPGCDCEHGLTYREINLGAQVRALVQSVKRAQAHPDIGIFMEGSLQVTVMPDEIALGQFDKLVLTAREQQAREHVVKGEDQLVRPFVSRVVEVSDSAQVYVPVTDYTVNLNTGKISWVPKGHAPAAGATYSCQYFYHPVYWFLTGEVTVPRPAEEGGFLPLRGFLTEKYPEGD